MSEPAGVGINGGGRIGLMVYRALQPYIQDGTVRVAAINDLDSRGDPSALSRALRLDSTHGRYRGKVEVLDGNLTVDGHNIILTQERDPGKLEWKAKGAQIVLESTGVFTTARGEKGGYLSHLDAGADYVVISAPVTDGKAKMVVLGVNYNPAMAREHRAFSNASCTTNCLAPLVKVLHEKFGIIEGDMNTIHAYTKDQELLDGYHKDPRRARAATNLIPTTTGAATAIGIIFPDLGNSIGGNAISYRVPVQDGSVVDFLVKLKGDPSPEDVNAALEKASKSEGLEGILEFSREPLVSGDIIGNSHSSIVDGLLTSKGSGGRTKVVSWYDNEWGYANRSAELIVSIAREIRK